MKSFTLKRIGKWLMLATFSLLAFTFTHAQCDYSIDLTDTYGDGWNGNSINVYADGVEVPGSPFTLASGNGPETYYFPVVHGKDITTNYNQTGGWPYENGYQIYDALGNEVFSAQGASGNGPPSLGPGVLFADCPPMGDVEGFVLHADLSPADAEVGIIDYIFGDVSINTDPSNGYYHIGPVMAGTWQFYFFEDGINFIVNDVTIVADALVEHNVTMAPPLMVVTPLLLQKTMNPNEWLQDFIGIQNIGDGDLFWTAEIIGEEETLANMARKVEPVAVQAQGGDPEGSIVEGESNGSRAQVLPCPDFIEEPIWSQPGDDAISGRGSEASFGWYIQQHFTLTEEANIGFVVWWDIFSSLGNVSFPRPYTLNFYEEGNTDDPIATFDVEVTGEDTGYLLFGFYPIYQMYVELPEAVDMGGTLGWFGKQSTAGTGDIAYWLTHSTAAGGEPALFNGAPDGIYSYSACFGASAGGAGWLSLNTYEGSVPANGGSMNVAAMFDATGTTSGEVYNAMIAFTAQPALSTTNVQATMIINGEPLIGIEEFEAELVNMATGQVDMSWVYPPERDVTFDYFLIRRNNMPVANTQDLFYTDMLPTYGTYNYTVQAVFVEGESVPAGPEEVIWLIPVPCFTPDVAAGDPLTAWIWQGFEENVPFVIENCGEGVLSFEFPGFDDPDFTNAFVVGVSPYMGQIAEGESMTVNVTFSAVGYPTGTADTYIDLVTNALDPLHEIPVLCEMNVYAPAVIEGMVTNCSSGAPMANVTVLADGIFGQFTTETDATGNYMLYVEPDFSPWGAYFMVFNKLGFEQYIEWGVNALPPTPTTVDVELCETPYPVKWVDVDPNGDDTKAVVTWSKPMGPYEIIYDDGTAENYFAWAQATGTVAVKFTPAGYPATVQGGRIFVGDGSYPEGGNFIGTTMAIGVLDDDGENGMPGTVRDSIIVTVNNFGWVEFDGLNTTFDDGNFFLAIYQLGFAPNVAPVGVDEEMPIVFRSYIRYPGSDMWTTSPYQDFMMRATVSGPGNNVMAAQAEGKIVVPSKPVGFAHISMKTPTGASGTEKGGEFKAVEDLSADRDLDKYEIRFVFNFDPDQQIDPEGGNGSAEPRLPTTSNTFTDNLWGGQDPGFYAYGVKAVYDDNESEWVYSNIAAHLLDNKLTVNVAQCDGEAPANALVLALGQNFPYQALAGVTGESGVVVFDSVITGMYNLTVAKTGYQTYVHNNLGIYDDHTEEVMMLESTYPPRNLMVDPLTSMATWNEPLYIQLPTEGFENGWAAAAADGWTRTSPGAGWVVTEDGSSSFWTIPSPPESSGDWYIVSNDDHNSGNPQDDYLITPMLNLTEGTGYTMSFLLYYDAGYGQPPPELLYSTDNGNTWEDPIWEATAGFDWQEIEIDLAEYSDLAAVKFALYAYDNGGWLSGVAADNFYVGNGAVEILGYHVFLEDGFVTETDAETTWYQYNGLQYGTTYTASVAALYGCNLSQRVFYTWMSGYLYPPINLTEEYIYGTNEVPLFWNPPVTIAGPVASFDASTYTPGTSPAFALEADPNGQVRNVSFDRDVWDILYGFEMEGPSGLVSLAGGESDGEFIYASVWNSGDFVKFLSDGTFVETFNVSGAVGTRDMAFDGTYMYGAAAATTVWEMDFTAQTMEGSISAPTACRALAYDEETNTFWGNNWDSPFTNFDRDGASLGSITVPSIYGAAFDNCSDDGPYIWVFSGTTSGGGCQVEQMDVTGAMTGEGHGVSGDFGSGGIAGGLYIDDGGIVPGLLVLGGTMQAEGTPAFGYEIGSACGGGGPGEGDIPAGLASFNVYRNGDNIGSVPYMDEGPEYPFEYRDNNVDPGTYDYTVTAVYDLTTYGFPGETGESPYEGPTTVEVVWGIDLPFMETWDNPSLAYQDWRVDGENWVITSNAGNPEPSAEFTWDPDPGAGYALSLTTAPLNADQMTEGDIWLDFEVMLNNRNATGMEKLAIEVYNGQDWSNVFEFSNAANMDWTFQHLQITSYAMSRVFQVRFTAMGEDSFDIISWLVDNISVYRTCAAPSDLDGEYLWNEDDDFGAEITWEAPDMPAAPEGWLYYHDGTIEYVWGSDAGDWESDIAMWFDPTDLADFPECAVTEVALFSDSRGANGGYVTAKVYEGPEAATLLYEEDITGQMLWNDDMTYVTLAEAVPFDNTKDLWIVFTTGGPIDVYIGGITMELPAPARKGDLYREDGSGWTHLSDLGIGERAWILEAYVTQDYAAPASTPVPLVENREFVGNGSTTLAPQGANVTANAANSSRAFEGFNIYRMGPNETEYSYLDQVAYETGVTDYSYYDEDPFDGAGYPYEVCYQVTGVWGDETDYCESPPAKATIPIYDYVCIMVTSIDNPLTDGMTALYPNPATDRVNIASSQAIDRITIVNYIGQVIYDAEVNDENNVVLNTSNYDAGMYIVRINTANGVVTKRMTISN